MTTATTPTLEERVAALEASVAEIRKQLPQAREGWLEAVTGSITDLEVFEEMVRLGRAAREAERENVEGEDQP